MLTEADKIKFRVSLETKQKWVAQRLTGNAGHTICKCAQMGRCNSRDNGRVQIGKF